MIDLILGRGLTDIIREMPFYLHLFKNMISIKLFHSIPPIYGSVDVNNVCNLYCSIVIGGSIERMMNKI